MNANLIMRLNHYKENWLKLLNYYILQCFFIRLAKIIDTDTGKIIGLKVK